MEIVKGGRAQVTSAMSEGVPEKGDKLAPINAAVETHTYKGVFVIVDHLTFQVR